MPKGKSLVLIKRTGSIKDIDTLKEHAKYIGFRAQEKETNKGFFGRENDNVDYREFVTRVENNKALKFNGSMKAHKVVFSLRQMDYDAYKRSGKDFKDLIRATLKSYEEKNKVKLDWIANVHETDGHPHSHIIIKGVSDVIGDRGYSRIRFEYPKDFNDMKIDFEREFMKDVNYKLFEREEIREIAGDLSKGFDAVMNSIKHEINKDEKEREKEKGQGGFSKLRNNALNKEKITKEHEINEKRNENLNR